ncbi:MAG: hypothetical protein RR662_03930 [Clostridia bacterium]
MKETNEINELVVNDENKFLMTNETVFDAEELEGLNISLDAVKIPAGGVTAFEVPGDNPDEPEMEKELVGIIVDHYHANAYYEKAYDGNVVMPTCSSFDGKQGTGNPGGACKTCPFNQYGSVENGQGKACKNMHRLYILREGEMLPIRLTLPPTSIKSFSDFLVKRVMAKGNNLTDVITKITLKKVKNAAGIEYAQAQFTIVNKFNKEDGKLIKEKALSLRNLTRIQKEEELYNDFTESNKSDEESSTMPF